MPSVGSTLQEARLKAALELDQISTRTRISLKVLQAMEADDLCQITSAFFYRSFVRQFCQNVGLPYEQVADRVEEACEFYPEPFKPERFHTLAHNSVVTPRRRAFNLRTLFAVASFVILLGACSAVYSYWEGGKEEFSSNLSTVAADTQSWVSGLIPGKKAGAPDQGGGVAAALPPSTPEKANSAQPDDRFRVKVSAIEPSWLSIVADGRQRFSGILEPDQSKVFEGREHGRVRIGNAGGLSLVFNGKRVGTVGPRGQVRVVVFTPDKYEVLDPDRVAAAAFPQPAAQRLFAMNLSSWSGGTAPGLR